MASFIRTIPDVQAIDGLNALNDMVAELDGMPLVVFQNIEQYQAEIGDRFDAIWNGYHLTRQANKQKAEHLASFTPDLTPLNIERE